VVRPRRAACVPEEHLRIRLDALGLVHLQLMLPGYVLPRLRYQVQVVNRALVGFLLVAQLPGERGFGSVDVLLQASAGGSYAQKSGQANKASANVQDSVAGHCLKSSGSKGHYQSILETRRGALLEHSSKNRLRFARLSSKRSGVCPLLLK